MQGPGQGLGRAGGGAAGGGGVELLDSTGHPSKEPARGPPLPGHTGVPVPAAHTACPALVRGRRQVLALA